MLGLALSLLLLHHLHKLHENFITDLGLRLVGRMVWELLRLSRRNWNELRRRRLVCSHNGGEKLLMELLLLLVLLDRLRGREIQLVLLMLFRHSRGGNTIFRARIATTVGHRTPLSFLPRGRRNVG